MANVFLSGEYRDIETAIMLEQANVIDIGNAVAYTDGDRVFLNTDDNLFNILPSYNYGFLKWLLWHERYHMELRHHNRFFKYLHELSEKDTEEEFFVTKNEVNIIMDILVHDSLCKMFPELVMTATENLAQLRNRNSLKYTFTTFTLEEMLEEYRKHKKGEDDDKGKGSEETKDGEDSEDGTPTPADKGKDDEKDKKKEPKKKGTAEDRAEKDHGEGGSTSKTSGKKDRPEDGEPELKDEAETPGSLPDEHDKTDWKKLEQIDDKEFIDDFESGKYMRQISELKRKKFRLGKLTETLNGLATSTRQRTYAMPSPIKVNGGAVIKGSRPGKTPLYLCFDASGSMGAELETFKEIISKSIPQAMEVPCEWFTHRYGKGKFKDIMKVYADSGFSDDGDRTIDLCWKAEQAGYSPIGVTDGGGQLSWSKDKLKQLKRTIIVGQNEKWLEAVRKVNPRIQTLHI